MPHSETTGAYKLNNKNLPSLKAQGGERQVSVPNFDRSDVKEGIVHVGVGGFHRAHLAVYVDGLMGQYGARDWAICGVGLQPFDASMRDALTPQDCLYTVIERGADGSNARVIGSINSFLFAPDNKEAVIAKMAHPDTHIVSMTITESGYYYNENTHELEVSDPNIAYDLTNKGEPRTIYGYLFEALSRRYDAGLKPFTVLSCDNMQKNGSISRNMLLTFARKRDAKIADWIAEKGGFPNSMVDRITPRTVEADKKDLAESFGIEDSWPVVTEPFMQWVVEDKFADGRPPFEKIGVQVVPNVEDVEQFEMLKLRLLNGSHSAMAYTGYLAGFTYIHEVIQHPMYRKYVVGMMNEEVKPLLPSIPGVDTDKYISTLLDRFSNPTIKDEVTRVALGSSGKVPQFIMPSIAEQIWRGDKANLRRLTMCAAGWFRYLAGTDEQGKEFDINDPMAEDLRARAREGRTNPVPLLNVKSLFGDDLRNSQMFIDELTKALESMYSEGAMATLAKYVD